METQKAERGAFDELLMRHLECEDRPESIRAEISVGAKGGWLADGTLPDGRRWGVELLLHGAARLHVWNAGRELAGVSDETWDYCAPVVAVLAVYEWEGIELEPRWWRRCNQSGRRRYYKSDGSFREEVRE